MQPADTILQTLRDAVRVSPDNLPLRQHLADTLLQHARFADAESEYRTCLSLITPNNDSTTNQRRANLRRGLVHALAGNGKSNEALALLVEVLRESNPVPAALYLLHARLLVESGNKVLAIGEYLRALDLDPTLTDTQLAAQLGLQPDSSEIPTDASTTESGDVFDQLMADIDSKSKPRKPTNTDKPSKAGPSKTEPSKGSSDDWLRVTSNGDVEDPEPSARQTVLGIDMERPTINFSDVGGMANVKEEINIKIIQPLVYPQLYAAYGKKAGGGILMYGPPGCGKTHLARATAGEIQAKFIAIGIHDVLDMYMGNSEQKLHEIFELARRNQPCVLFFDEVDALGASRRDMRASAGRHLINQFLQELDGVHASNEGVLILAATNAPWHLDSAFRRPGRFDRILFVPPPDAPARSEILRILLRDKPTQDIDTAKLGQRLQELSGADLKALVDAAIEGKLREAMKSGKPTPLQMKDLEQASKSIRPSTKEWFMTARNYALYSNEGGLYDDILVYLGMKK